MLIVGLTGGIGCGKSTVSKIFEALGAPVIDADVIAHDIVQPGKSALIAITKAFGTSILNIDQSLNRSKLRNIIYNDSAQKKVLEKILHPIIYDEMYHQLELTNYPYGILSIPLLLETHHQEKVTRVLVIDCTEEEQISRVISRDQLSKTDVEKIIAQQCSRTQRLEVADDIIKNSSSVSELSQQVQKLHHQYLNM